MSILKAQGLTYVYGEGTPFRIAAITDVNFEITEPGLYAVIGHTGSGKSTLIQHLNGLIKPTSGTVFVDDKDIWSKNEKIRDVRFKVGIVFQYPEYQLFEETIYKDIAYGPKNMGLDSKEIDARVREAAEFAGLDAALLSKSPFDLSGGQKRRAAIAGIIAMRPELLILDEPAAGLDPRGRDSVFANIVNYQKKTGSTVLIVSHSMEDMARYCERLVVMERGRIILEGDCDEVFSHAKRLEEAGLDIPQIAKLALMLSQKGIDIGKSVYTVEDALEGILKLYE